MPRYVKVAKVSELPQGNAREFQADGKVVALYNVEGKFYCTDNVCLHRGGPLGEGYLDGEKLECPWHGWQFDVKTGAVTFNPRETIPTYEVKIEGSDILVAV